MLTDKVFCQNVFHVACIEECIINLINFRVYFCIFYCLWNVFNTNDFLCLLSYEVSNSSCTSVEVIYEFVACKVCKFSCNGIEMICLFSIGLVETLWTYLEPQVFHRLKDMVITFEKCKLKVVKSIVTFLIINVEERSDLWESVCNMLHQSLCTLVVSLLVIMELYKYHPFASIRVAHHNMT